MYWELKTGRQLSETVLGVKEDRTGKVRCGHWTVEEEKEEEGGGGAEKEEIDLPRLLTETAAGFMLQIFYVLRDTNMRRKYSYISWQGSW